MNGREVQVLRFRRQGYGEFYLLFPTYHTSHRKRETNSTFFNKNEVEGASDWLTSQKLLLNEYIQCPPYYRKREDEGWITPP